jgi:2,5-dichlorohydroquinone reductive dechlorinase
MARELREALNCAQQEIGEALHSSPRYELFHAANSICSQKVRTIFAHQGVPYVSREMNITAGQTYLPSYVRIRTLGCSQLNGALASTHTGSTSVTSGGCDAAVVPTLVDWNTDSVIVDSKRICLYLDERCEEPLQLRPTNLAAEIDAELSIVDDLPNYQLLMGRPPDGSQTPVMKKGGGGPEFSLLKVARCDRYLSEFSEDQLLVHAYTAKRDKELHAARHLFSPSAMKVAYEVADSACQGLEVKLSRVGDTWLFGATITLADVFWGVALLRMKNIGVESFWNHGRRPRVALFVSKLEAEPSFRSAVLDWPGALF